MIYNVTVETTGNGAIKHASYRFEIEEKSVLDALLRALNFVEGEVMVAHIVSENSCRLM